MSSQEGATTLIGRTETHGRKFPHFVEMGGLLIAIVGAIYAGRWIWIDSGWEPMLLWPALVCGLPLATVLTGEIFGRVIQKIHRDG